MDARLDVLERALKSKASLSVKTSVSIIVSSLREMDENDRNFKRAKEVLTEGEYNALINSILLTMCFSLYATGEQLGPDDIAKLAKETNPKKVILEEVPDDNQ